MLWRLGLLAWLILLGGAWLAPASAADKAVRPNILFIYADDQNYKTVSCEPNAYRIAHTPHIDSLANSGIRFFGGYLGSWCMPSRASLLTGRHPHGIESMRMEGKYPGSTYDPEQCRFWPSVFRQHGYQTAQIGKWHTGTDTGFGRDWDFQIVWNRPLHPENAGSYYGTQVIYFNGEKKEVTGYSTDNYTQWACDYIRGENRDPNKPWYLWLCYGAIHGPTTPADRHKGKYAGEKFDPPADIYGPREGKPAYLDKTQVWAEGPNGEPVFAREGKPTGKNAPTFSKWIQQVNECMLAVDEGVGKVIEALRESGQLENTLVVYSADQGFANGEHGMRAKVAPYDANYRSPMIVSMPGRIPQGKYCKNPVNAPDLVVTFFAQAGIEVPWSMHGRDLSPLLENPETQWNHPTMYEHTGQTYGSDVTKALAAKKPNAASHSGVPYYVALRHGPLKYVRYLVPGVGEELYDLNADPEELTNLIGHRDYQSQLAEMRELWQQELRRTEAPFADDVSKPAK